MDYKAELLQELEKFEKEHKELDETIGHLEVSRGFSEFTIQQLKKRKLFLKDKIRVLRASIYSDIIA